MDHQSPAFTEAQVIARLREAFASTDPRIEVGIGDDAAVVVGEKLQVMTTDMAVEGVHFRTDWSTGFEIGRKVTAANAADILAMGAVADYLLVAVALTPSQKIDWIDDLARGIKFEADLAGLQVIGGDISSSEKLVISMTAVGHCKEAVTRDGAKAGDGIYLSSLTGWSAASKATAMCDISDSIVEQSAQIAKASQVALNFDKELFSRSEEFADLQSLADELQVDVWDWIFGGGEDHVLLATGVDLPGLKIGEVTAGEGVFGIPLSVANKAWSHFR